ncbi:3-keto-disaccharide hydrolase [Rubritalea tangerina]|uniref:DUF1080 domain-containing protein n=1 Tax=Rubritalea tangerina TaxID=430798 RepID=A0ABW4ZB64_9BACT
MTKSFNSRVAASAVVSLSIGSSALAEEAKGEWTTLFDGKTTKGWTNYNSKELRPQWKVVDGSLQLTERGGGDIVTEKEYENFEFKVEWKVPAGEKINSGIFIGVKESERPIYQDAIEAQIMGNEANPKTPDLFIAGSVFGLFPSKREWSKPSGEWNSARVWKKDDQVKVFFNEQIVADFKLHSEEFKEMVSKTKFKQWPGFGTHSKGKIGFQDHGNTVGLSLRNIMVREL